MSTNPQPPADGPVVSQPGATLALDLFVLDQHVGALLDTALAGTGLTASAFAIYSQLARGAQTPGQLSATLGLRPTTLSGHLAAMERAGHLTRTRRQEDGRSRLVALTDGGLEQVRRARPAVERAFDALHSELGGEAPVSAARRLLGRLDRAVLAAGERIVDQESG